MARAAVLFAACGWSALHAAAAPTLRLAGAEAQPGDTARLELRLEGLDQPCAGVSATLLLPDEASFAGAQPGALLASPAARLESRGYRDSVVLLGYDPSGAFPAPAGLLATIELTLDTMVQPGDTFDVPFSDFSQALSSPDGAVVTIPADVAGQIIVVPEPGGMLVGVLSALVLRRRMFRTTTHEERTP
jgi:hypothetical protein